MTDKEYAKQKKRIQALSEELIRPLGFSWFKIDMHYERSTDESEPRTVAICSVLSDYMIATITWFMPEVATLNDEELQHTFIHELSHILTAPLARLTKDNSAVENSTELVAKAIGFAMKYESKP